MFVIQIADVTRVLREFSCLEDIVEIEMIAYYQEYDKTCIIISAQTSSSKKYVLKFLCDKTIDIIIEEKRSEFSEFLCKNGIPVPKKYLSNGKYCIEKRIGKTSFIITVEDYFGTDVKEITAKSSFELGKLLGNIHKLSYDSKYSLGLGNASAALLSGKVEFTDIWKDYGKSVFEPFVLGSLGSLHNSRMKFVRELWKKLPTAAVHGDLALTSNLVLHSNQYGIIDFNLAGDEPLLGDLLITWYSSRYSGRFIQNVPRNSVERIKNEFFKGYFSSRNLTLFEEKHFEQLSKIFNGVYFNRMVSDLIRNGEKKIGIELSKRIFEHYFKDDTTIDFSVYFEI